jgi:hypothetical protein
MQGVRADMMCLLSALVLRRCMSGTAPAAVPLQDNLDAIARGAPCTPAAATLT